MQMKTDFDHPNARDYIASLAAKGRYHFLLSEANLALGGTIKATKLALNRLAKKGLLASPARGFYVVVPPEYHSLECLPADQFIPALMKHLGQPYYAGLLSAAQYHGAAHHRPQEFQVVVAKPYRPIQCGSVRVAFMNRKQLAEVPVQSFNTPRGTILVSTPEATALDLVGYYYQVGGLDQVATILADLAEALDGDKLVSVARLSPLPWAQRLGYLLESVEAGDKARLLKAYVQENARQSAVLLPTLPHTQVSRNKDWKLYINTEVEVDL